MKRIGFLICALCVCAPIFAKTINWYVDGDVYHTTTCSSGDSVTPPTAPAKYGYTFQQWQPGFVQIEYLESTGTQYIDTEIILSQYTAPKIEITGYVKSGIFLTGTYNGGFGSIFYISTDRVAYDYSAGNQLVISGINGLQKNSFVCEYKNGTFTLSGDYSGSGSYTRLVGEYPLYLFGRNTSGSVTLSSSVIYNFRFYDNDTLVRDMIPVLDKNGIACMLDKVSGKFFYNAGTGTFTAGPVL